MVRKKLFVRVGVEQTGYIVDLGVYVARTESYNYIGMFFEYGFGKSLQCGHLPRYGQQPANHFRCPAFKGEFACGLYRVHYHFVGQRQRLRKSTVKILCTRVQMRLEYRSDTSVGIHSAD